jgi:hypothetical protein
MPRCTFCTSPPNLKRVIVSSGGRMPKKIDMHSIDLDRLALPSRDESLEVGRRRTDVLVAGNQNVSRQGHSSRTPSVRRARGPATNVTRADLIDGSARPRHPLRTRSLYRAGTSILTSVSPPRWSAPFVPIG